MTRFLDPSFSSRPSSEAYRKGWDAVFGKKKELERCEHGLDEGTCGLCEWNERVGNED